MKLSDRYAFLFLSSVVALTAFGTWFVSTAIVFTADTFLISLAWLAGFAFLFLNVSYLFQLAVLYPFLRMPALKETFIRGLPKTALVYPIRNEEHGLYERIDYSLAGNKIPDLDLWILSDSSPEYEAVELVLVTKLKEKYGERIHYRRREVPYERKQGNLKEFLHSHPEVAYIYVADADGMVPRGVILKLLRKAEHPDNRDVAVFQCFVKIAHAKTWYARFERIGTAFAQRFNFTSIQALFGRSISFGHHHLVRAKLLHAIKLPKGLLSHDNWDTVLFDQMGYRVAFCPDVFAYDEAPSNYLEARARSKRWAQGTLQGWPLVFKTGISLTSRLLAAFGLYLYVADIVFFGWVILGLLAHSAPTGELIHFQIDSIRMGLFANSRLVMALLFSLGVILFHKVVVLRNLRDFREYLYELAFSTLITLNNFFYVPLDIVTLPLRKLDWRPMKKNPLAKMTFSNAAKNLWPGTLLGLIGFYFCTNETPYFVWQATPILLSLIFSIVSVYLTSKSVPEIFRPWV